MVIQILRDNNHCKDLLTVEGVPFPSVFHTKCLLSQELINLHDQCKFQLLVPVSISTDLDII